MLRLRFALLLLATLFHCSACAFADRTLGVPVPIPDTEVAPPETTATAATARTHAATSTAKPAPAAASAAPAVDVGAFIVSDEATCAAPGCAPACCDAACCDPCERCLLGSLIARFDAAYENALAARRHKRQLCNQSCVQYSWCGAPCDAPACSSCSSCNSFAGYGAGPRTFASNAGQLPARFAPPAAYAVQGNTRAPAPQRTQVAQRSAEAQRVATQTVSSRLAPDPNEIKVEASPPPPAPTKPADVRPTVAPPTETKTDEPLKLNSPQGEAGAKLMPAAPRRNATARVERAEFSAAQEGPVASAISVAAEERPATAKVNFSEPASVAAVPGTLRSLDNRPAVEIRFKSDLDDARLSDANPLR